MATRPNKLLDKLIASNSSRARKDISNWRVALQQAENIETPKRGLLYGLYDELVLDAHLSAEFQKRVLAIRGCQFSIFTQTDGNADIEKTALFEKPWFYQFLDLAMESVFYGHSLMQIGEIIEGEITDIVLVNRRHVVPEKGLFIFRESDEKGILYREDKKYNPWLLEIGKSDDLGLLNKTAPHVLYKRFANSAWSEYCEIFGMPLRYGKTNVKDVESLNRMENMMINMGSASYAVIDDTEEITFVDSDGGNGDVYNNLIKQSNSEISKLINGAVIGEASGGGSRSKEEVGERTGNMISEADKQFLEGYINNTLIPKLIVHGYPLNGFSFRFEKSKNIDELWKITNGLLTHYDVDEDFINNTFGVPVTKKKEPTPSKLNTGGNLF